MQDGFDALQTSHSTKAPMKTTLPKMITVMLAAITTDHGAIVIDDNIDVIHGRWS